MIDFKEIFEKIEKNEMVDIYLVESTLNYFIAIEDYKKCMVIQNHINSKVNSGYTNDEYEMIREIDEHNKKIEWLDKEFEKSLNGEKEKYIGKPGSELFKLHEMMYNSLRDSSTNKIKKLQSKLDGTFDFEDEKRKGKETMKDFFVKCKGMLNEEFDRNVRDLSKNIQKEKDDIETLEKSKTGDKNLDRLLDEHVSSIRKKKVKLEEELLEIQTMKNKINE